MGGDISARTLRDAARMACRALDLEFREAPADGLLRRLTAGGGRKDGGLKLFEHGRGGIAWNFSTAEHRLFFVDGGPAELTEAERRKLKRLQRERRAEAEKELTAASVLAAARARRLWKQARSAPDDHAFLERQGIEPHGLRQHGAVLLVPVAGVTGKLISLQLIAPSGARHFLRGSQIASGYHVLGNAETAPALIIAADFETSASLHEATGHPAIIAFSASNLARVTEFWRRKLPGARIVIAAIVNGQEASPGAAEAREAAAKFGGVVATPDFAGAERQRGDENFNALARLRGLAEVKYQIEAALAASAPRLRKAGAYEATDDGLYWNRETRESDVDRQRLANFCAWIAGERIEDDGAERRGLLDVEATIHGRTVRFPIPTSSFTGMGWAVEHIGADAVIEPGFGARDRARAAIQYLSGRVPRHYAYAHTGWRRIDGHGWTFLHRGGAIGADGPVAGVDVDMAGSLAHYRLPSTWSTDCLAEAVRASLAILEIAPDRVTVPLIGAAYRAVLGGADFSLHLSGFTGSGKSELAALAQQHFGAEMTARNLPGAWSSTANQLEGLAFSAKDALLVIDDYVPQGSAVDRARQNATADRVLRGVGNAAGRGRAGPDGRPRPARPPRALVLSTGEDIPGGQSLRARTLIIEVAKGDIGGGDLRTLTAHQKAAEAGQYAMAMAGFIQWLAADFDAKRHKFEAGAKARRHELAAAASHARTADIAAQLATAWRVIAAFAVECRAISEDEREAYLRRADEALAQITSEQSDIQSQNDPIERFRALINGAVASGRAHIAGRDGGEPVSPQAMGWRKAGLDWQPQGKCIGWEDGAGGLYLEPEASFAAAQEMGAAAGEAIGVGSATLRKRLHERGLLLSVEQDRQELRFAVRKQIGGQRRRVVHVANLLCRDDFSGPSGPSGPETEKTKENQRDGAAYVGLCSGPIDLRAGPSGPGTKKPSEDQDCAARYEPGHGRRPGHRSSKARH